MEIVLLGIIVFLLLLNSIVIFSVGLFLVHLRDRVNSMFVDILEAMSVVHGAIPELPDQPIGGERAKTWDEKYEEELEMLTKRLREGNSGLQDLDEGNKVSWGQPPNMNPQNSQDLIIKDV